MKKYLILLSIILIIVLGVDATKRFSHAEQQLDGQLEAEGYYTLKIKQETENNKEGEFTYRIKAFHKDYEAEEIINSYTWGDNGGDGPNGLGAGFVSHKVFTMYNYEIYDEPVTIECLKTTDTEYTKSNCYISDKLGSNGMFWNIMMFLGESTYEQSNHNLYKTNIMVNIDGVEYYAYSNVGNYKEPVYETSEVEWNYPSLYIVKENIVNYDLSSILGQPDEEGYYTFTLSNNDTKTIQIPEGYEFELKQILPENWELVSINGSEEPIQLSGTLNGNLEYTFLNKKTVDDEPEQPIVEPEAPQEPTDPTPNEPTPTEPVNPVKEDKPVTPKTENVVPRSVTPNTVDKIIIDVELLTISMLVMGIMIMLIKRTR